MSGDDLNFIQKKVSQRQRIKIEERIPANFIKKLQLNTPHLVGGLFTSVNAFFRSAYVSG